MRINDGTFVAARDGKVVLGHVDRPFDLWEVHGGILVLLAEIARGTTPGDLPAAVSPFVDVGVEAIAPVLNRMREAGFIVDTPAPALRDVHLEIAKVIGAAPDVRAEPGFLAASQACEELTLTSAAARFALWSAVKYVVANGIPGALVECGVWRGGSMVLTAHALLHAGVTDRDLYLYDTFEWSWEDTGEQDGFIGTGVMSGGAVATPTMGLETSVEAVRDKVAATGYPLERVHCVKGLVQDTVPGAAPDEIALLRLDTDQYESTLHELRHLYPRVSPGGSVIIDDYGKLTGATRATDEYLTELGIAPLLHRIDTQGRIFVK